MFHIDTLRSYRETGFHHPIVIIIIIIRTGDYGNLSATIKTFKMLIGKNKKKYRKKY